MNLSLHLLYLKKLLRFLISKQKIILYSHRYYSAIISIVNKCSVRIDLENTCQKRQILVIRQWLSNEICYHIFIVILLIFNKRFVNH